MLRNETRSIMVGNVQIGGQNKVVVQSMCNTPTKDAQATIAQINRLQQAGCEIVRMSVMDMEDAKAISEIKTNTNIPLVADIHFDYRLALASIEAGIDKIRINPGNIGKRENVEAVVQACKQHHIPIRIGINSGSLEKDIHEKYGKPCAEGMMESAQRHVDILESMDFHDIVLSFKSSDPLLCIDAYRQAAERFPYPLHLGVTEAGDGEDGRIKSAVGIGALLADGIGDTVRVSLTEDPEAEMPVAQKLVNYIQERRGHQPIVGELAPGYDPIACLKRKTRGVEKIGSDFLPVVISDRVQGDFEFNYEAMPDFIYIGQENPENLPDTFRLLVDAQFWKPRPNAFPYFIASEAEEMKSYESPLKFIRLTYPDLTDDILEILRKDKTVVVVLSTHRRNGLGEQRAAMHRLMKAGVDVPVILHREYNEPDIESVQLKSAADLGALLLDGFGNGIMLHDDAVPAQILDQTMFGILQAAKVRISKTEYISCPSCGRTLYDLQTTIARIKEATSHLKGLKIGIMGCIVNGPGEMADADYGYVGAGRNQISLYKGKECLVKNIPEEEAVERLVQLIKDNGDWK